MAGNKWTLAGEPLLSPRDKGCRGRPESLPVRSEGSEISVVFRGCHADNFDITAEPSVDLKKHYEARADKKRVGSLFQVR